MLQNKKPQIFGAGLITLDVVFGANPDAPIKSWTGGTCGNVMAILSYLGWSSYPIGRLNYDSASQRVMLDLQKWKVNLDFISCCSPAPTPIIIQQISHRGNGMPIHTFSWSCPNCGHSLPRFKAITRDAIDAVKYHIGPNSVFFMDRLSRATLKLAEIAASNGGIIFFEPSSASDTKYFNEAINISHIVKYASQRVKRSKNGICGQSPSALLEICTYGENGLEWRYKRCNRWEKWNNMKAFPAHNIADTCGSGDWCTAGIISMICTHGISYLENLLYEDLAKTFKYSQILAAWNCGFEGARGGMYSIPPNKFSKIIEEFALNRTEIITSSTKQHVFKNQVNFICPSCGAVS